MAAKSSPAPILQILPDHVAGMRKVADARGLTYTVVEGQNGVSEFRFQRLNDDALFALLEDVPDEAWADRAITGDPWAP
jgi:hypothetical protein